MSHRTNYAIRQDGAVHFATHRHGGISIPDLLFQDAEQVRTFIDELDGASADDLYSEAQCEGLLLLDYDEQLVLFDGVSELMFEGAHRRMWYPLIANVWAGWRLLHTPDPVRHMGLYLGLPEAWHAAKAPSDALALLDPARLLDSNHAVYIADEQTEAQWRDDAGTWHHGVFDSKPVDLLACGPALLDVLASAPSVAPVDCTPPWGVLRIDMHQRRLHVWTDLPTYRLAGETAARWSGWNVERIGTQTARSYSQHPERFSLTPEETEQAMTCIEARLDYGSHTPFRDALRLHDAFRRERRTPPPTYRV